MTRDDIIRMAQECNLIGMRPHLDGIYQESLERFAALVAANTLANIDPSSFMSYQEGYEAGRLAEREACAKVVENHALGYAEPVWAFKLIDTIRARGIV